MTQASSPLIDAHSLSKSFSGVSVLRNVSFSLRAGECLGLVGENGAGKSTLMKIISGVWPYGSYGGHFSMDQEAARFSSPRDALAHGIFIVHQELSVFENLSVAENLFMGHLPASLGFVNTQEIDARARELLKEVGLYHIEPQQMLSSLRTGEKQMLEIARALFKKTKLIIFDEPTSALSDREIHRLFELIDQLKSQGMACIVISHKLDEIRRLCDRILILRDGDFICDRAISDISDEEMIRLMVGRTMEDIYPAKSSNPPSMAVLEVSDLSYKPGPSGRPLLRDISFSLRRGEILGIGGLLGAGRSELLLALFGALNAQKLSGELHLNQKKVDFENPRDAIQSGIGLVTEDRKLTGAFLELDISENLTLPGLCQISSWGLVNSEQESEIATRYIQKLNIKCRDALQRISHLSGGNQQKVLLARWLARGVQVLLLDEPTRGIDIGAKAEIYRLLRELSREGMSIVLVSSEMPELLGVADRILVMREGRLSGELTGDQMSQENIMRCAAGVK